LLASALPNPGSKAVLSVHYTSLTKPPVDVSGFLSRLQARLFDMQRGLFVSDLGRLFLFFSFVREPDPSASVLGVALQAARSCGQLASSSNNLASAERSPPQLGVAALVATVDRDLRASQRRDCMVHRFNSHLPTLG
ncbi:MAG: hypothetical protein SGPRY_013649, partial [Prymnesium sp.]